MLDTSRGGLETSSGRSWGASSVLADTRKVAPTATGRHISDATMGITAALGEVCADLSRDQYAPNARWIADMVRGMAVSRSPMLSEIGLALIAYIKTGLILADATTQKGFWSYGDDDADIKFECVFDASGPSVVRLFSPLKH